MTDKEEKFIFFYMEQTWNEMRHLENLRERVSALILTITSLILGFVIQQKFAPETKLLIWLVIALGFVGILMGLKIFQIHQMGQKRLDKWNKYVEENCGDTPKILNLRREADKENKKDFKLVSWIPHNYFWTVLYLFIIAIGFIMLTQLKEPKKHINKNTTKIETVINSSTMVNHKSNIFKTNK